MHLVMDIYKIRYSHGKIEQGEASRKEEQSIIEAALENIRRNLKVISNKMRKPFVFLCVSEGATTLSILSEWYTQIESVVQQAGGTLFVILNTGVGLGMIDDEEYQKRLKTISTVLHEVKSPKIITNNVIRRRRQPGEKESRQLTYDNSTFDYYFSLMLYSLALASAAKPHGSDLENLFSPGSIHVVTTPSIVKDYVEFNREIQAGSVGFMSMGHLGGKGPAPLLVEVEESVDGCVIVGYSERRVKSLTEAFKKRWPSIHYCSYSIKAVRERTSRLNRILSVLALPIFEEQYSVNAWSVEPAVVFFTAKISSEEAIQAIDEARKFFKNHRVEKRT